MASFGAEDLAVGLKVVTTVATGFYTGGAWFLLFGAVPSARSLKPSCCFKVTKSVFQRCFPMAAASLVSLAGGTGVYLLTRGGDKDESCWLLAPTVFGIMQPYTLQTLMPINKRVLNDDLPEDETYSTMDHWWNYHLWRTLAASGCFLYFSYLLAKK